MFSIRAIILFGLSLALSGCTFPLSPLMFMMIKNDGPQTGPAFEEPTHLAPPLENAKPAPEGANMADAGHNPTGACETSKA